jgi:hypothetical protein
LYEAAEAYEALTESVLAGGIEFVPARAPIAMLPAWLSGEDAKRLLRQAVSLHVRHRSSTEYF